MAVTLYLKWTRTGRIPSYQGGTPIPARNWTNAETPILCRSGWHACRWEDAVRHISDELWVCELAGDVVEGADKVVASSLRLVRQVTTIDDRALRLFAADCAEDVLHLYERDYPGDLRPRKAIAAARAYANGEISDAARDAARAAARAAARDAARAAARDAARAAAWAAAWAAQTQRLLTKYAGLDPADFTHRRQS
jgi:hypothetical protein